MVQIYWIGSQGQRSGGSEGSRTGQRDSLRPAGSSGTGMADPSELFQVEARGLVLCIPVNQSLDMDCHQGGQGRGVILCTGSQPKGLSSVITQI